MWTRLYVIFYGIVNTLKKTIYRTTQTNVRQILVKMEELVVMGWLDTTAAVSWDTLVLSVRLAISIID